MAHSPFQYQSLEQLQSDLCEKNITFTPATDFSILNSKVNSKLSNRLALQAMEGCDGNPDGSPSPLTIRRYLRFAGSGAAFQYIEATAVIPTGRANPRQLMITKDNVNTFADLVSQIRQKAKEEGLTNPYLAIQLTHSGRYSKNAQGTPAPVVAAIDPERDPKGIVPKVITDEELDQLVENFVTAAHLAKEAGIDCVDIKCCHGYLINELTGAFTRQGKYGGSFENRTRFLKTVTSRVAKEVGIDMMVRLNVSDEYPYPYGFGVDKNDFRKIDLTEPKMLVDMLIKNGVSIIDCTAGNPYYNPHVNRPFDKGGYVPPVHQLHQIFKHWESVKALKEHNPNAVYIASMFTWLRHFAPHMAASCIQQGWFDMAGFGRQSFAYPTFAKDILQEGEMNKTKCCFSCSKCTDLMRTGNGTGCVLRDEYYTKLYQSIPQEKRPINTTNVREKV